MTLAQARKHYEYTLARFDEADREDRGWRRVAMERAKEELDRLTVEPPPNPSAQLMRLQLQASVMREALVKIATGEGVYGAQAYEYKQIARTALAFADPLKGKSK